MAALSAAQKADVIFYCGWSQLYKQFDYKLDQALRAIEADDAASALITNALNGSPPGLLALLRDIDARILLAHKRLKAMAVGSIQLDGVRENAALRADGRRMVRRLCAILGVERREDVFAQGGTGSRATIDGPGMPGNYVGK